MKTYHRIIEYFWLVVGILTLGFAIFIFTEYGFTEDNYFVLVMPFMSLVLFGLRRAVRKRFEKNDEQSKS